MLWKEAVIRSDLKGDTSISVSHTTSPVWVSPVCTLYHIHISLLSPLKTNLLCLTSSVARSKWRWILWLFLTTLLSTLLFLTHFFISCGFYFDHRPCQCRWQHCIFFKTLLLFSSPVLISPHSLLFPAHILSFHPLCYNTWPPSSALIPLSPCLIYCIFFVSEDHVYFILLYFTLFYFIFYCFKKTQIINSAKAKECTEWSRDRDRKGWAEKGKWK